MPRVHFGHIDRRVETTQVSNPWYSRTDFRSGTRKMISSNGLLVFSFRKSKSRKLIVLPVNGTSDYVCRRGVSSLRRADHDLASIFLDFGWWERAQ